MLNLAFTSFTAVLMFTAAAPPNQDSVKKALLKRDTEWSTLASAGKDVDKVVSYWSTDAVVYPPGQPMIEGTAAIRSYVSESYKIPGFRIGWKSHDVTLSPDEKMAYMRERKRGSCARGKWKVDDHQRSRHNNLAARTWHVAMHGRYLERATYRSLNESFVTMIAKWYVINGK